ncbi:hypothetical protein D9M71_274410 [compost metagenome]
MPRPWSFLRSKWQAERAGQGWPRGVRTEAPEGAETSKAGLGLRPPAPEGHAQDLAVHLLSRSSSLAGGYSSACPRSISQITGNGWVLACNDHQPNAETLEGFADLHLYER